MIKSLLIQKATAEAAEASCSWPYAKLHVLETRERTCAEASEARCSWPYANASRVAAKGPYMWRMEIKLRSSSFVGSKLLSAARSNPMTRLYDATITPSLNSVFPHLHHSPRQASSLVNVLESTPQLLSMQAG